MKYRRVCMAALRASGLLLLAAVATGLSGCASWGLDKATPINSAPAPITLPPPPTTASVASPASPAVTPSAAGAATAAPPAPAGTSGLPAFAQVIKDARKIEGPITAWQKDEKVWLELGPEHWGTPYLLSPKLRTGIGEGYFLGGLMASTSGASGGQVVEFLRVHNQVRLVARNQMAVATPGSPQARAVDVALSPSLLSSSTVSSQPHPERKTVLVEANALFLTDMLAIAPSLQRAFRQNYNLDSRHTAVTGARATPQALVIETQNHYYTPTLAFPQPGLPIAPTVPGYLPDARSLFVGLHFSLAPLPKTPMAQRRADPRVGHFSQTVLDFSDDLNRSARQRYVSRWRLERKDPGEGLSEPVQPITYWLDRNIPLKYRATIEAGILEWNKAFERIGFKHAIVVKQQPDDAGFDTLDVGVASVRWMVNPEPRFGGIGPHHRDPRTGEILDADIAIEGLSIRGTRSFAAQVVLPGLGVLGAQNAATHPPGFDAAIWGHDHALCLHAQQSAEQLAYALDVLESRDDLEPDSAEVEEFVQAYLKDLTMHEVGHTLGLRHNFRASRLYSEAQLASPSFTQTQGTSGSVMDYNAVNISAPGKPKVAPFQPSLGPYDYWAIEYAYKPIEAPNEPAELQRIAARSHEPGLGFATDEDVFFGLDPEAAMGDLGSDTLAFASKRLAIARDVFKRQENRVLRSDRDYAQLRRSLNYALSDVGRSVGLLVRQIAGVRTLRDFPGSGRDPLTPVPASVSRQALALVIQTVFSPTGLSVSPALQRRLAPDFQDRSEINGIATDFPVAQRLTELQRATLSVLMSDAMAIRILDAQGKQDPALPRFSVAELFDQIDLAVWSELTAKTDVSEARQAMQREYLNRLADLLLRPGSMSRASARNLVRGHAQSLLNRLNQAKQASSRSPAQRAHWQDCVDTLSQALSAKLPRAGV
ncbi:MAG: hypothetical protein RIS44_714 [Pseudomonadota bacterium]